MKKGLLLILTLTFLVSVVFAGDYMLPGYQKQAIKTKIPEKIWKSRELKPDSCLYTFSIAPFTLLNSLSYYDYMIGGYNDLPIGITPQTGGYFLTYHGKNTPGGIRRVYYAYITEDGDPEVQSLITQDNFWEGYPSIAVDPLSGKPLYAWHYGLTETDPIYDVRFSYDTFFDNQAGLMSTPVKVVDNQITDTLFTNPPVITTDNEYLWPSVHVGPSPTAGMSRVYILTRNSTGHIDLPASDPDVPSENVRIIYADFNADMLEMGAVLSWQHTNIPTLDLWNTTQDGTFRRPNCAFTVGDDGRIYYVGSHSASYVDSENDGSFVEPDLDAFVCDNYGEGTWTRIQGSSEYPSWNPKDNYGNGVGFFTDNSGNEVPVPRDSLFWGLSNSAHINAVFGPDHKIHILGIWAQQFNQIDTLTGVLKSYFHPTLQNVKELVFDIASSNFSIREIYPMAGTPTDEFLYLPWDKDGNGTTDAYWSESDPDVDPESYGIPKMSTDYPFSHWDDTLADDAMMFHYSNTKITKPNSNGMMAAVWQDSDRARLYNQPNGSTWYPELANFADTPEIWISCSPDNGLFWSEPFSLNKVETPALAGMKPMYVYPAEEVKYVRTDDNGRKVGKLALMFYDDMTWGSFQMDPPAGPNDGGYVKFTELEITFANAYIDDVEDQVSVAELPVLKQNYPNPFNPETTIKFEMPKKGNAHLSIYNIKGQLVKTLVDGPVSKGEQKFNWKGVDNNNKPVASGLYLYKLDTGGKVLTRKMMLMK